MCHNNFTTSQSRIAWYHRRSLEQNVDFVTQFAHLYCGRRTREVFNVCVAPVLVLKEIPRNLDVSCQCVVSTTVHENTCSIHSDIIVCVKLFTSEHPSAGRSVFGECQFYYIDLLFPPRALLNQAPKLVTLRLSVCMCGCVLSVDDSERFSRVFVGERNAGFLLPIMWDIQADTAITLSKQLMCNLISFLFIYYFYIQLLQLRCYDMLHKNNYLYM